MCSPVFWDPLRLLLLSSFTAGETIIALRSTARMLFAEWVSQNDVSVITTRENGPQSNNENLRVTDNGL